MAEPALQLRELRKRYGETVALDGVSFAVGEGEMFGFVGPNGAGKTTTMRIVLGVLGADSGAVTWRGGPIGVAERRRIGYMPEERGLYPKMRVRDQLVYMARLHGAGEADAGAAADRWLERLGIAERGGDPVEALSLGNQQRVQLAVALVHEPDLLVLDEPFSGLDPDGVDALAGALTEEIRARGVPVIFSSHQLELVERLCDSVAIIAAGRIATSGRLDALGDRPLAELFREATRRPG
jgi:ABC-2 type transport system ATP-binding protein